MNSSAAQRYDTEDSDGGDCFNSSYPAANEADFCSRDGAHTLKATIEAYWLERGQNVQIMLHNVGFHPAIRAARFDVRSDMINGMPRGAKSSAKRRVDSDFDTSGDDLVFE